MRRMAVTRRASLQSSRPSTTWATGTAATSPRPVRRSAISGSNGSEPASRPTARSPNSSVLRRQGTSSTEARAGARRSARPRASGSGGRRRASCSTSRRPRRRRGRAPPFPRRTARSLRSPWRSCRTQSPPTSASDSPATRARISSLTASVLWPARARARICWRLRRTASARRARLAVCSRSRTAARRGTSRRPRRCISADTPPAPARSTRIPRRSGRVKASIGRSAPPGPAGVNTASASPPLARRARVRTGSSRKGASLGTPTSRRTSDPDPRNTPPLSSVPSMAASKLRTAGEPGLRRASLIPSVRSEGHDCIRAPFSHEPDPRRRPSSGPARTGSLGG